MDQPTLRRTLDRAHDFLRARQAFLYGSRSIRFEPEAPYADFDGMLKREVVSMRFDVLERLAEGRLKVARSAFEITISHGSLPSLTGTGSVSEAFSTFLVRRKYLVLADSRNFLLTLPSFEGEVRLLKTGSGVFGLQADSMIPRPSASYSVLIAPTESLEAELLAWLRGALADWTSDLTGKTDVRLLERQPGDPDTSPGAGAWLRISRIDVDASGEERPHVLRWQESNRASSSRFAELTEADCLAILGAAGAAVPGESRVAGIFRDELPDDAECVTLRYVHELPDPSAADQDPGVTWRRRGAIVVEGDYWEFHIDEATRTLLGESRKWRPVDGPTAPA